MNISVAMATYNGEKYILDQMQSILSQTRQADEVVLVDDSSQDRTVFIIQQFIASHNLKNWVCTTNEVNLGYRENFRKAMDLTTGDLIFLCDQDDIWPEDRLEKMTAEMEKNPKIGLLNTNQIVFCGGVFQKSKPGNNMMRLN